MPLNIAPDVIIDATLYTLLLFSMITWTLIVFKIWQFTKNNYYNQQFNHAFWQVTDLNAAQSLPADIAKGAKARVAACGFTWLAEMKHPRASNSLKFRGSAQDLL